MLWMDLNVLLSGLGLVIVGVILLALDLRHWPLQATAPRRAGRALLAGVWGVALMLFPLNVAPGVFVDLRYVPGALMTLLLGPGWGSLALLMPALWRVGLGGAGVPAALLAGASILLIAGVVWRAAGPQVFMHWRWWWASPLIFSLNSLGLLLFPGGHALVRRVYLPVLIVHCLGLWAAQLVVGMRARHLAQTTALRREAYLDALTGVSNRRQFDLDLARIGPGDQLIMLDIDYFKQVNDRLGHAAGDQVLREVAQTLAQNLRGQDHVYRVGGEEFALILCGLDAARGRAVTQRCLDSVRTLSAGGQTVTLSAGWSQVQPGETPERALARADAALYRAKGAGRDRLILDVAGPDSGAQAAQRTLTLLAADQDPTAADWHALLESAVQGVPGAQAGTLFVLDRGDFLLCAQQGFSDDLLGHRRSPASLRRWYADPAEAWQAGEPRVLRDEAIRHNALAAADLETQLTGQRDSGRLVSGGPLRETLGVPVSVDGLVLAFLNLDTLDADHRFGPDALQVARSFAQQVAALLRARAARLRAAARQRELEALARITEDLRDARTTTQVAQAVTGAVMPILAARESVFLRFDPERDELVSLVMQGVQSRDGHAELPRGYGVAWAAIEQREVLRVTSVRDAPRLHRPTFLRSGAMLAVPLQAGGTLFGALCVTREDPFGEEDVSVMRALGAHIVTALDRARQLAELQQARTRALLSLGKLLEARGLETPGHIRRLRGQATRVAETLQLSEDDRAALLDGAALHDLGLLDLRPGQPDLAHATAGEALARELPGVSDAALGVIRHHHERWDGQGHPDGLRGHRIPALARILTILDTFDTLTHPPHGTPPLTPEQALSVMTAQARQALDPDLLTALTPLLSRPFPPEAPAPAGPLPDNLNLN
ncbi:sensor domain-containing diguanylate cyclase/phosphohydrolase [Deinococcus depolymerans]|uniref:Diguanylate cyclase n=1 Tax=Deinococcus depolymerans TaxID=392408 RepID=A0ABN1C985_9DEIO